MGSSLSDASLTVDKLAQRVAEAVDEERVASLTRDLVRIRSVFEPGVEGSNERRAAEFVASVLAEMGLEPILEEATPGRPNVVCDWQGSTFDPLRHKTLMFEGHTDVVTEGDASSWRYPPFAAELVDGCIYGRGSADMKAGVAAAICALQAVKTTVPDLAGRIRLGIVADEEGMMQGIKHFIRQGWADEVDGAVVCEPEENELCLHQKGAMRVGVHFQGVMSHGAMPYAGVNPVPWLAAFVRGVGELEAAEQARLGEHEYLGFPWLTPTTIRAPTEGEQQLNVMPETAYLALDIRTVPGQEHEVLFESLEQIAESIKQHDDRAEIRLELIEERPWTVTDADDPLVSALEHVYPLIFQRPPAFGGVPGATDGTFLRAWANVPIVTVGPGDRTIPHQRDEFVKVQEVIDSARLYAAAAVRFLSDAK